MPVTAKLSRSFYEALGDDVANELVEWFNQVDATYRSELKALNELNFQRFDAKLDQRLAEFKTQIAQQLTQLEVRFEQRFGQLETKVEKRFVRLEAQLEKRLADQDAKLAKGLTDLDAKFEKRLTDLDAKWEARHAALQARVDVALANQSAILTRRMFAFWVGTVVPLAGLLVALHQLG